MGPCNALYATTVQLSKNRHSTSYPTVQPFRCTDSETSTPPPTDLKICLLCSRYMNYQNIIKFVNDNVGRLKDDYLTPWFLWSESPTKRCEKHTGNCIYPCSCGRSLRLKFKSESPTPEASGNASNWVHIPPASVVGDSDCYYPIISI